MCQNSCVPQGRRLRHFITPVCHQKKEAHDLIVGFRTLPVLLSRYLPELPPTPCTRAQSRMPMGRQAAGRLAAIATLDLIVDFISTSNPTPQES
jgi:hypothetical protein